MTAWLQMGSYFGSSLCAVDLNMDGLSDLLVGAPMFSEIRDEGQVTVYLNQGHVSKKEAMKRWGSGKEHLCRHVTCTHWTMSVGRDICAVM